jgi:hypothetical protein
MKHRLRWPGSSKYSAGYSTYSPPETKPDVFIDSVVNIIEKWDIQLVIPMTELNSTLLLENSSMMIFA